MQTRVAHLLVCLTLSHCASAEGGAVRDDAALPTPTERATSEPAPTPRPAPPLTCSARPGCTYSEPIEATVCYGVVPPPNAPSVRATCSCDACMRDDECAAGEACVLWSASCRPAQRICAGPCDGGSCPSGLVCQRGRCGPPGIKPQ